MVVDVHGNWAIYAILPRPFMALYIDGTIQRLLVGGIGFCIYMRGLNGEETREEVVVLAPLLSIFSRHVPEIW